MLYRELYRNFVVKKGGLRYETLNGRKYAVASVVMIQEGVHCGSGGCLFYPAKQLSRNVKAWDGKPVTVYHPTLNGQPISAAADTAKKQIIGFVKNTTWDKKNKKLRGEVWVDIVKANKRDPRIMKAIKNDKPMEVSTGLYGAVDGKSGVWNTESYDATTSDYEPDHLALLPDVAGACSVQDGCGLFQNRRWEDPKKKQLTDYLASLTIGTQEEANAVADLIDNGTHIPARIHVGRVILAKGLELPGNWNKKPLATNELSYSNINSNLGKALDKHYPYSKTSGYAWVADVYQTFVVYGYQGRLWQVNYKVDEQDNVTLEGTPVEVKRVTEYRTVAGNDFVGNATMSTSEKDSQMTKMQKVAALTSNADSGWDESDEVELMKIDDKILDKMIANLGDPDEEDDDEEEELVDDKPPKVNSGKSCGCTDGKKCGDKKKGMKANAETKPEEPAKPTDVPGYLETLPPEVRKVVQLGLNSYANRQESLVTKIMTNKKNKFSKERLMNMEQADLEAMAALIEEPAAPVSNGLHPMFGGNFMGNAGGPPPSQGEMTETALVMPSSKKATSA